MEEVLDLPGGNGPMVEIRKLSSVFHTPERRIVVHKDLDLTVQRGEVLSIVGGSGSGKTVLLRQILGLEHPAAGEVRIMGQTVDAFAKRGASSRVGMLFQHGALFSAFSVLENVAFPLRELKTLPSRLVPRPAAVKASSGTVARRATTDLLAVSMSMGASDERGCAKALEPKTYEDGGRAASEGGDT